MDHGGERGTGMMSGVRDIEGSLQRETGYGCKDEGHCGTKGLNSALP